MTKQKSQIFSDNGPRRDPFSSLSQSFLPHFLRSHFNRLLALLLIGFSDSLLLRTFLSFPSIRVCHSGNSVRKIIR
ncbi:hypothetical protein K1719_011834 [Acacia pycnantha]|nr:hypothetical protein K1719_011834 [Acacia pycnantha]